MKKLYLATLLLSACNGLLAKEDAIKLSSTQELNRRLCTGGFAHFVEKTEIDKTLGDQKRVPLGVAMAVELALYDYSKYNNDPIMDTLMQMNKPIIIEIILEGHPQAIDELKARGLL